ncbi:MAG: glucose-1-phosphate adenylyltransferase [Ruminococcaceae bacterium]|nr:glucose-1-phosphate adenylyltransferase [Oscillospiraceae bacterium]
MFKKKECVAMLLAGGQGSRLFALTQKTAKPAVSFGGKYRIIDFPLSNCINSGVDTVGVLTQYRPLLLNEYIGNGLSWDLDRRFGGVQILAPYQGQSGADWYRGTANAIWQNMEFINRYDAKYVLILSGDHIYKMDYAKMLEQHKKSGAACTIAVLDVPIEEASRFGIMSTREDGSIFKFTEKPKNPDSTKASMGIYVFTKDKLEAYLKADNDDPASSNDFGKNIIPTMLASGEKMMSYSFEGYWKDVGTIQSLWEANMDLLGDEPAFSLLDEAWRIYSRHAAQPPQYIAKGAVVENASVTAGCQIFGTVKNSVLGANVYVGKGAVVEDSVIMNDTVIEDGATVQYAILDEKVTIGKKATVGAPRESGEAIAVVGAEVSIGAGEVVAPGAMLSEN